VRISERALSKPVTVFVVTAAVLVLGVVSLTRLKLDFLPKMEFPFIGVYVPYPNSVPSQVEKDIARPIEEIMATLGDVREVFSQSDQDGSFIGVTFDFGHSVDILRLEVKERMEQVRPLLPGDIEDYFIFTFNSNDIPIMVGRISAPGRDLAGSYDLLERRIMNPIRRVEGVGRLDVGGISPKDVTIYLFLDKIVEYSVDVERLFQVLNANNMDLSLGRIHNGKQRVGVRALGQFRSMEEIENLQVTPAGIRLKDVAAIVYGEPEPSYYRRLNGEPAIAFQIQKASGANIVEVSERVREALDEIQHDPSLEGITVVLFFDQAQEIKGSLKGLLYAGLVGSFLAVGILLFFLRRIRTTLIVSIAIPLSVISTCTFLYLSNRSLNVLTMCGLMLAVGMLVDNAIVVLESIFQRQERGGNPKQAAALGAREVATAVIASTLTSVIVFAPVVLSKGTDLNAFLGEVGVTISITLIFSLIICLTLVPLLASRSRANGRSREFGILGRARTRYLSMLKWTAIKHPLLTGAVFLPVIVMITIVAMQIAKFKPDMEAEEGVKQDRLYFTLEFVDNTNRYRVVEYVDEVEEFLLAKKDSLSVESIYTFYEDNNAEFSLFFPEEKTLSDEDIRDLRKYLRESLPVVAGIEYRFGDEEDAGRGATRLSVTVFGEDSDLLEEIANEAQRRLSLIPDVEDVRTDAQRGKDEIRVVLDRNLAGRFGFNSRSLSQILGLTFRGVPLRKFQGRDREVDMGIVLEPSDRRDIESLAQLPISYREGRPILLGQVAHFEIGKGPQRIFREQRKTAMTVIGSYEGEEFSEAKDKAAAMMNSLELPAGYSWSFGRELRESEEQQNEMGLNVLIALCCVYFVMAALFESFLHPLVIMLCIPFAALGVIWTLMVTSTPLNVMAMIGIVILIGIVVNNGIVLIDHVNNLRRRGLKRSDAIIDGCRERFRPIIMTASTTILGLLPLAVGTTSVAGGYYFPLARAVMGGLAASTILTLIVLPTFYVLAEKTVARVKLTFAWGMGRQALPWRRRESELAGARDSGTRP